MILRNLLKNNKIKINFKKCKNFSWKKRKNKKFFYNFNKIKITI